MSQVFLPHQRPSVVSAAVTASEASHLLGYRAWPPPDLGSQTMGASFNGFTSSFAPPFAVKLRFLFGFVHYFGHSAEIQEGRSLRCWQWPGPAHDSHRHGVNQASTSLYAWASTCCLGLLALGACWAWFSLFPPLAVSVDRGMFRTSWVFRWPCFFTAK